MAETPEQPKRRLRRAETDKKHNGQLMDRTHERRSNIKGQIRRIFAIMIGRPLGFIGRLIIPSYLRGSGRELQQVTWPTFKQSRQLTGAVIIFALVFGILVATFDYGLDKLFKEVIVK